MVLKVESAAPMLPTPLEPVLVMLLRLTSPAVIKLPLVVLPVTVRLLNVPTEVMLGCAAVVTVPAVVAEPAEPLTEPVMVDDTVNELNVPTEVMLGCAAVVTVPAVVADATVPVMLPPGIAVRPAPDPKYVEAVTFPLALNRLMFTLPVPCGVSTMLASPAVV